ncbi:MAG TPA: MBL fold metallo-hydrolase [Nitrospira sp.]|nr:MBL fold metallo-hydrolase [Nitrospira sp.]MBS0175315.1 MBL fold metallo-hydrolase [Nitrospira sp.]MCW5780351.1 MBL fold metallo-hydrolase [Nitrospira sp.]HNI67513.1 MBL fold metallo-hydrolase [Nitrospira sp.]
MPISKWFPCWLFIGCLLMFSAEAAAQSSRPDDEITKLADDVYIFRHQFHQAVFITTPKGVIVTDPISADAAAWLNVEIKKLTDQPVRYVIYSHHHNDHITGGSVFAGQAIFVSHALARPNILEAADPTTPVPDLTFTDRLSIDLGGTQVELIYTGKNHSDNSVVMLLPQRKLLFAVDFIPVETVAYRTLNSDYPDEWIESLKKVEQLDFEVLVPGHGKIGRKDHVRLFRGYLEDLRAAVLEHVKQGRSLEETKQAVRLPKYEQWQRYADWFPENVEGMYRYLSQTKH